MEQQANSRQQPNYYAIITANVRYSDVTANAKLLYGEITALSNKDGYCWASNQYFAELYGVNKLTVSGWIKSLVDAGFIISIVENRNERKLYIKGDIEKGKGGYRKTQRGDIEKGKHNSTVNSTTNISEQSSQKYEIVPDIPEDDKVFSKRKVSNKEVMGVLGDFNEILGVDITGWGINTTQRRAIGNLLSRGDKNPRKLIVSALEYVSEHKEDKYMKWIFSPDDLDKNWNKIKHYKDIN